MCAWVYVCIKSWTLWWVQTTASATFLRSTLCSFPRRWRPLTPVPTRPRRRPRNQNPPRPLAKGAGVGDWSKRRGIRVPSDNYKCLIGASYSSRSLLHFNNFHLAVWSYFSILDISSSTKWRHPWLYLFVKITNEHFLLFSLLQMSRTTETATPPERCGDTKPVAFRVFCI